MNVSGNPESYVQQIARTLNARKKAGGPPTVLFLGSRTSSLFRRPFLADLLKGFTDRDLSSMTPVERFQECYRILETDLRKQNKDSDIHFILREALKERQINTTDLCIAELMKQSIFDYIITTNIGGELERAFHQSGMEDPYDFEVILPGSGGFIASRIAKGNAFKMLKAYGDFASKRYSIYGHNIDSREFFLEKYPEIRVAIEQVKIEEMLMVGFDYRWDRHLLWSIFPRKLGSLWYVNEEQTRSDSELFDYLQDSNANRFEDPTGGYEPFFVNLCKALNIAVPTAPTGQTTQPKIQTDGTSHTSDNIDPPPTITTVQRPPKPSSTNKPDEQRDFFISYNSRDRQWAEWIAWQLEQASYSVFIQAWDFLPGENFVLDMQQAALKSKRTIAVLTEDYLDARFTQPEWAAALAQDPMGNRGILLPVRVREFEPQGLWKSIVYINLVGSSETEARERLLEGVKQQRLKPDVSPPFPGERVRRGGPVSRPKVDPLLPQNPPYPQNLPPVTRTVKVFYLYSPKDDVLLEQIETHLALLRQMGLIKEWHSGKLTEDTAEWAVEIRKQWQEAQIILLLVSADFISSNYDVAKEAIERHQANTAKVIPIILRPTDWRGAVFSELQVLPDDGKPITSWANQDEALLNVAKGIRKVVEELTNPQN